MNEELDFMEAFQIKEECIEFEDENELNLNDANLNLGPNVDIQSEGSVQSKVNRQDLFCVNIKKETETEKEIRLYLDELDVSQYSDQKTCCNEKVVESECLDPELYQEDPEQKSQYETYKCNLCEYKCSTQTKLQIHLQQHSENNPYKCSKCDYFTRKLTSLRIHEHVKHSEEKYKCSGEAVESKCLVPELKHEKSRQNNLYEAFTCSICTYKCDTQSVLLKHLQQHDEKILYKCARCGYLTQFLRNLREHQKRKHSEEEKQFKCKMCSYTSMYLINFVKHVKNCKLEQGGSQSNLSSVKKGKKKGKYTCSRCSFSSHHPSAIKIHEAKHFSLKPFKCNACTFVTKYPGNLDIHKRISCPDRFPKNQLEENSNSQIKSGLEKKHYKCRMCSFSSMRLKSFIKHVQNCKFEQGYSQSNLKSKKKGKYICSHCSFSAHFPSAIKTHEARHFSLKPFKCNACTFATKYPSKLVTHKRTSCPDRFPKNELEENSNSEVKAGPEKNNIQAVALHRLNKTIENGIILKDDTKRKTKSKNACKNKQGSSQSNLIDKNKGEYKCSHCSFYSRFPSVIKIHEDKHLTGKPYVCSSCTFATKFNSSLRRHQREYGHTRFPRSQFVGNSNSQFKFGSRKNLRSLKIITDKKENQCSVEERRTRKSKLNCEKNCGLEISSSTKTTNNDAERHEEDEIKRTVLIPSENPNCEDYNDVEFISEKTLSTLKTRAQRTTKNKLDKRHQYLSVNNTRDHNRKLRNSPNSDSELDNWSSGIGIENNQRSCNRRSEHNDSKTSKGDEISNSDADKHSFSEYSSDSEPPRTRKRSRRINSKHKNIHSHDSDEISSNSDGESVYNSDSTKRKRQVRLNAQYARNDANNNASSNTAMKTRRMNRTDQIAESVQDSDTYECSGTDEEASSQVDKDSLGEFSRDSEPKSTRRRSRRIGKKKRDYVHCYDLNRNNSKSDEEFVHEFSDSAKRKAKVRINVRNVRKDASNKALSSRSKPRRSNRTEECSDTDKEASSRDVSECINSETSEEDQDSNYDIDEDSISEYPSDSEKSKRTEKKNKRINKRKRKYFCSSDSDSVSSVRRTRARISAQHAKKDSSNNASSKAPITTKQINGSDQTVESVQNSDTDDSSGRDRETSSQVVCDNIVSSNRDTVPGVPDKMKYFTEIFELKSTFSSINDNSIQQLFFMDLKVLIRKQNIRHCAKCSFVCIGNKQMTKHRVSHITSKKFHCSSCEFVSCTKRILSKHQNDVHKENAARDMYDSIDDSDSSDNDENVDYVDNYIKKILDDSEDEVILHKGQEVGKSSFDDSEDEVILHKDQMISERSLDDSMDEVILYKDQMVNERPLDDLENEVIVQQEQVVTETEEKSESFKCSLCDFSSAELEGGKIHLLYHEMASLYSSMRTEFTEQVNGDEMEKVISNDPSLLGQLSNFSHQSLAPCLVEKNVIFREANSADTFEMPNQVTISRVIDDRALENLDLSKENKLHGKENKKYNSLEAERNHNEKDFEVIRKDCSKPNVDVGLVIVPNFEADPGNKIQDFANKGAVNINHAKIKCTNSFLRKKMYRKSFFRYYSSQKADKLLEGISSLPSVDSSCTQDLRSIENDFLDFPSLVSPLTKYSVKSFSELDKTQHVEVISHPLYKKFKNMTERLIEKIISEEFSQRDKMKVSTEKGHDTCNLDCRMGAVGQSLPCNSTSEKPSQVAIFGNAISEQLALSQLSPPTCYDTYNYITKDAQPLHSDEDYLDASAHCRRKLLKTEISSKIPLMLSYNTDSNELLNQRNSQTTSSGAEKETQQQKLSYAHPFSKIVLPMIHNKLQVPQYHNFNSETTRTSGIPREKECLNDPVSSQNSLREIAFLQNLLVESVRENENVLLVPEKWNINVEIARVPPVVVVNKEVPPRALTVGDMIPRRVGSRISLSENNISHFINDPSSLFQEEAIKKTSGSEKVCSQSLDQERLAQTTKSIKKEPNIEKY